MIANERQVGGDHYRQQAAASGEQHWDRQWRLTGRGYFIGQITRYAERYHLKNGLEDLEKILHYVQKLKELEQAWIDGTGPPPGDAGNARLRKVEYKNPSDPVTKDYPKNLLYWDTVLPQSGKGDPDWPVKINEPWPFSLTQAQAEELARRMANPFSVPGEDVSSDPLKNPCSICNDPNCTNPGGKH